MFLQKQAAMCIAQNPGSPLAMASSPALARLLEIVKKMRENEIEKRRNSQRQEQQQERQPIEELTPTDVGHQAKIQPFP